MAEVEEYYAFGDIVTVRTESLLLNVARARSMSMVCGSLTFSSYWPGTCKLISSCKQNNKLFHSLSSKSIHQWQPQNYMYIYFKKVKYIHFKKNNNSARLSFTQYFVTKQKKYNNVAMRQ